MILMINKKYTFRFSVFNEEQTYYCNYFDVIKTLINKL